MKCFRCITPTFYKRWKRNSHGHYNLVRVSCLTWINRSHILLHGQMRYGSNLRMWPKMSSKLMMPLQFSLHGGYKEKVAMRFWIHI